MKISGPKECGGVLRAILTAKYLNVPVEVCPKGCCKDGDHFAFECSEGKLSSGPAAARYIAKDNDCFLGGEPKSFGRALVDQWCDFCADIFKPVSVWICPLVCDVPVCPQALKKAKGDMRKVMQVMDSHLLTKTFFVGERITLADVSLFCSLWEPYKRVLDPGFRKSFKNLNRWFVTMANQKFVLDVIGPTELCTKAQEPKTLEAAAPAPKEAPAKKQQQQQQPKAAADDDDEAPAPKKEEKKPNPLDLLPPSKMTMDDWKRVYSNEDTLTVALPWLWEHFDPEGFSLWFCTYKYEVDAPQDFMVANSLSGWIQRLDPLRKYGFGSLLIFGKAKPFEVEGIWLFRGKEIPKEMLDCDDCELYDWRKADLEKDKDLISAYLAWEGDFKGKVFNQGKIFK